MPFEFVEPAPAGQPHADPLQDELALLELAAQGRQVAQLWEAPLSLVVPRTYQRHAGFEAARSESWT